MRRLALIIGVLALTLPAAAGALKSGPGDGTLAVSNAQGSVALRARGGIIGQFDQGGSIEVYDPILGDSAPPVLKGCDEPRPKIDAKHWECSSTGAQVRFRLIGGLYRVRIDALGIDLSVAGRGVAILDGSEFSEQTGNYALNGGPYKPFPNARTQVVIGTALPATVGSK
jgi:hypothetical protein